MNHIPSTVTRSITISIILREGENSAQDDIPVTEKNSPDLVLYISRIDLTARVLHRRLQNEIVSNNGRKRIMHTYH